MRCTDQRWYMFHHMGQEPAPRSGHGMVAVGSKVYILGGVSEDDLEGNDANVVYVLETSESLPHFCVAMLGLRGRLIVVR